jgi:hypothetical protein
MAAPRISYNEYSYPVSRLDILLDHLITIGKKYPLSFNRKEFSEAIGATPTSNGPETKLKDMVEFGLISKNDQIYVITDLGKAIIKNEDRTNAIEKIIKQIALWDLLYQRVGKKPTKDAFAVAFQQITHAENDVINRDLIRLWNSYTNDFACSTKTPPYSTRSAILGKQRISQSKKNRQTLRRGATVPFPDELTGIAPPKPNQTPIEKKGDLTGKKSSQDRVSTSVRLEGKLTVEYGSVKIEVKDESTLTMAMLLLITKASELNQQGIMSNVVLTMQKGDSQMEN